MINEKAHSIYLDNASTTKVDERVLKYMLPYFQFPSNPHSRSHEYGWKAGDAIKEAKKHIASLINSDPEDIVITSGATESNNLAIKGIIEFHKVKEAITLKIEHKCVLEAFKNIESRTDCKVIYLPVQKDGILDVEVFRKAITKNTKFASIMFANNEIGVIQPIKEIGKICAEHGIIFHVDAAQAFGKIPIDVEEMNINLLSISSHKIYGPMGVGALYVRRKPRVRLSPLFSGGGQERGMRSGTVPTALVAGFGKASQICKEVMDEEYHYVKSLRDLLYQKIKEGLPDVVLNGNLEQSLPGLLNLSFPYVEGESIIMAVKQLAVSSGSACTSASLEPSYVLRNIGTDDLLAHSSIRFGIGRFNTKEEIVFAANLIVEKIQKLLDMSPLWEMAKEGIDLTKVKWDAH